MAWNISGRLCEACTCNVACPCWLGVKDLMVMDKGWCDFTLLFEVSQGNSDGVDLSGRTVVVAANFPGPTLFDGNATARLYVDSGASAGQQAALEGIFSGTKGGPMEILAGLMSTLLPTQTVPISVQEDGNNISATIGNYGVIKSQPISDESGKPITVQNAMLFQNLGFGDPQIAPSGHRWTDPDLPRAFDSISGARSTFSWSGG